MDLLDIRNICYSWGIEVKDFNALSERATLIISTGDEKFVLKKGCFRINCCFLGYMYKELIL